MQPEYKNHIFHEIPDCPYPKHTVLFDEENGIKFMKYIGDVAMDAQGFIKGLFWLATAMTDEELAPAPPEPPPTGPQTATVPVDSAAILALATTPKTLVPVPMAGYSLEFQSATATLTFGTVPYVDAGGTAALQIRCGTVPVSSDVPASFLAASSSTDVQFTALPGITLVPDLPLTLALINGAVTGGDSSITLGVTYVAHPPVVP
jgi:hypothetical protein